MISRLTSYDLGFGSLWTLLAILNLLTNRRINIPSFSFFTLVTLGVIVGVIISILAARRMLMNIEKKGVVSPSTSYVLFVLGTFFIGLGLLYFGFSMFTLQEFSLVLIFFFPMSASTLFTRALTCKIWERKNKRVIYFSSGIITGKIYAYPYILKQ